MGYRQSGWELWGLIKQSPRVVRCIQSGSELWGVGRATPKLWGVDRAAELGVERATQSCGV